MDPRLRFLIVLDYFRFRGAPLWLDLRLIQERYQFLKDNGS